MGRLATSSAAASGPSARAWQIRPRAGDGAAGKHGSGPPSRSQAGAVESKVGRRARPGPSSISRLARVRARGGNGEPLPQPRAPPPAAPTGPRPEHRP
jgi:hypothetical protein